MKWLLYAFISFYTSLLAHTATPEILQTLDRQVEKIIQISKIPGIAYAIVEKGHLKHLKTIGYKNNRSPQDKINKQTIFRLASISKLVTAVLSIILEKHGILSLQDKIKEYVDEFQMPTLEHTQQTAIYHLLSHTVGCPRHTYTHLIEQGYRLEEIMEKFPTIQAMEPLGYKHAYQNALFSVLHLYLEKRLKKSLDEIYNLYLFKPLHMDHSSLGLGGFISKPNQAIPHIRSDKGYLPTQNNAQWDNVLPAAGVNASIEDMAKFLQALMGVYQDFLSVKDIQKIYTVYSETPEETNKFKKWQPNLKKSFYGLGCRIYDYAGHTIVGHGGWLKGFSNRLYFMPDRQIGIVVLSNSESRVPDWLWTTFFDAILGLKGVAFEQSLKMFSMPKKGKTKKSRKKMGNSV